MRQHVDGAQFDKMLKSNTLMDLGIDDLNPRLSLSIRRSWTTDFGSVNFVDAGQSLPQGPQGHFREERIEQPSRNNQPQQPSMPHEAQRLSAWDQDRMRNHPSRESQPPPSQPTVPRDHPSRTSVPGHRPWATYEDDPPPRSRGVGAPSSTGNSVASSSMARGGPATPGSVGHSSVRATDQFADAPRDLFGARPPVSNYDRPPYSPYGGASPSVNEVSDSRYHGGEFGQTGYDNQGYPDHRSQTRGVPPLSMGNSMGSTRGSMGGGMDAGRYDDRPSMPPLDQTYDYRNGHRDMSPVDTRGPPRDMRQSPMQSPMGMNGPGASWNAGLQETFVPRQGGGNTYAPDPAYESVRPRGGVGGPQSPMASWEGGLDVMLPPRERAPANVAQPYAKAAREAQQAQEMERAAKERAEAEARAAAEADAARFQRSQSPQASEFFQRQGRASQHGREVDTDWGGMTSDDAFQSKRYSTNGVANDFDSRAPPRSENDRRSMGNAAMQYGRHPQDIDRGGPDEFEDRFPPRTSTSNRPSYANGGFGGGSDFGGAGFENEGEDFVVQVKVPKHAPPGGSSRSPEPASRAPVKLDAHEERQFSPPRPRSRPSAAPPADDGWGGISLGDAFAKKKPAPAQTDVGGSSGSRAFPPRKGEKPPSQASDGVGCNKTADEVIAWVRSLPESHVPEKSRQNIAAIIEDRGMSGQEFTSYVKSVPPEICAPKHAMKLKAAWNNVLAEAACTEVARQNARNQPTQKAAMIVV